MFSLIVFTSSYEYQDHKEVGQKRKRIPEEDGVEGSRRRGDRGRGEEWRREGEGRGKEGRRGSGGAEKRGKGREEKRGRGGEPREGVRDGGAQQIKCKDYGEKN